MHAAFAHADTTRRIAAHVDACAKAITTRTTTTTGTGTGTPWRMRLGVVD
ncbi:hypothetical protein [Lysobacter terrae]